MPLYLKQDNRCLWGIWKMEESPEELLAMLDGGEYHSFIKGPAREHRKKEWLSVRVLLKALTGKEIPIAYTDRGAPFLPDEKSAITISHTKGFVAVLLNESGPAGIDIEYRSDRIMKIRSRFMNPEEEAFMDKENEIPHLLVCWCAKEALFKALGEEAVDFREHLHIEPFSLFTEGSFTAYETRTTEKKYYRFNYMVTKDFALAYCVESSAFS